MALKLGFLVAVVLISSFILQAEAKGNGSKCRKNSQCDSGNCCGVWPFKRCRQCCQDSDCPGNENCKYVVMLHFSHTFSLFSFLQLLQTNRESKQCLSYLFVAVSLARLFSWDFKFNYLTIPIFFSLSLRGLNQ